MNAPSWCFDDDIVDTHRRIKMTPASVDSSSRALCRRKCISSLDSSPCAASFGLFAGSSSIERRTSKIPPVEETNAQVQSRTSAS